MRLSQIHNDEEVLIDTNILVYANQQKSDECRKLLRRCAAGEVKGVVSMPIVAELAHALMIIEARENGWIERTNPARVVIDSLSEMRLLAQNPLRYRRQIFALKHFLAEREATVLLVDGAIPGGRAAGRG